MLGQLFPVDDDDPDVPDEVVPFEVVVVVGVAAKDANPIVRSVPTATIARIAIMTMAFLLGKDLMLGLGAELRLMLWFTSS